MFVSAVMFRLTFSRCFSKTMGPHEPLSFFNFVFHNRGTIHALLVNSAVKRGTIREGHIKQELKYYEVKYACVHGRKHYSSRSKGLRSTR